MEAVIQWVRNLVFIILFTTLLEMFLPESNMRKYVRVVLGLFIISILISPLTAIFGRGFIDTRYLLSDRLIKENWEEIQEKGQQIEKSNQSLMTDYYSDRIKTRIKEVLNLQYQNYQKKINLVLDDNYRLEHINIEFLDKDVNEVKVNPIKIDERIEETGKNKSSSQRFPELKTKLSQIFQIPLDNINIKMIDREDL
ncbi:MAG: stage III sporulation protein AF [Halothermotrichaceae bacterium]